MLSVDPEGEAWLLRAEHRYDHDFCSQYDQTESHTLIVRLSSTVELLSWEPA